MRSRIIKYSLWFLVINFLTILSILLYIFIRSAIFNWDIYFVYSQLINFLRKFESNLLLFVILSFILFYIAGIFDEINGGSKLKYIFYLSIKIFVTLIFISFIEFILFFDSKLGRIFYINFFVLFFIFRLIVHRFFEEKQKSKIGILRKSLITNLEKMFNNNFIFKYIADFNNDDIDIIVYDSFNIDNKFAQKIIEQKLKGKNIVAVDVFVEKNIQRVSLSYFNFNDYLKDFNKASVVYLKLTRFLNILISILVLSTIFPLTVGVALIHKIFWKGPIFYIQDRVGENGKIFKLIKFRTMVEDAERDGPKFSSDNDPRITPIGKFMRKTRLDEIPQFINVLKGEMNIVGPRPERPIFVEKLSKEIPYYKLRLLVKPGITGWAQVKGDYAGNDIKAHREKLEYDLFYIKNRNLFLDLIILGKTLKKVFEFSGK